MRDRKHSAVCPKEMHQNGELYTVAPNSELHSESHVVVRNSTIDSAGNAIFFCMPIFLAARLEEKAHNM